jgi:hypothetical protein
MDDLRLVVGAVAVSAALIGVSFAAEKITLACSGMNKTFARDNFTPGFPTSISVVVDLDQATVTTMYGVFPITNSTENRTLFAGEGDRGAAVRGSIDRISGTAGMSIRQARHLRQLSRTEVQANNVSLLVSLLVLSHSIDKDPATRRARLTTGEMPDPLADYDS